MAAGESYRGKNGTQGAMGFGGRLYPGASSSVCPEATAPPSLCLSYVPPLYSSLPTFLCSRAMCSIGCSSDASGPHVSHLVLHSGS